MRLHAQRYPSPRRPIARRPTRRVPAGPRYLRGARARAPRRAGPPFFLASTRHVESPSLGVEIGRAVAGFGALVAWATVAILIAG